MRKINEGPTGQNREHRFRTKAPRVGQWLKRPGKGLTRRCVQRLYIENAKIVGARRDVPPTRS